MGMKREAYEEALKPLTFELVSMARWAKATGTEDLTHEFRRREGHDQQQDDQQVDGDRQQDPRQAAGALHRNTDGGTITRPSSLCRIVPLGWRWQIGDG